MNKRSEKFKKKLSGDNRKRLYDIQKDEMVKKEGKATEDLVEIEKQVKSLCSDIPTIYIPYYIIFGKEIYRLKNKHTAETLEHELCILCRKWWVRGLNPIYLNKISNLYTSMACFDIESERGLPYTGQTIVYVVNDDGTYQKGFTLPRPIVKGAAGPRFTDHGDGTVTDEATGLMWVKYLSVEGRASNWADAIAKAKGSTRYGYTDWRLPNAKELISIFDYSRYYPVDSTPYDPVFTARVTEIHWTSTTWIGDTTQALVCSNTFPALTPIPKATWDGFVPIVRLGKP